VFRPSPRVLQSAEIAVPMLFPGSSYVAALLQKITLAPNCTCRDGVAVESNSPAVPGDSWLKPSRPPKVKLLVGAWKFAWLKTLKASTLSWRLTDSEMRVSPDESGLAEGALAREAAGMAFGRSTAGAQGYMGTTASPWTWATSLYFPDTPVEPLHRIFICAETQSVHGRHLRYGNRPRDVDGNIRTALNITIYVIGNCVAGYGRVTSTQNLSIRKSSLAEFYSSPHQQLCHQGSDGANGFSKAKSDPRRQTFGNDGFRRQLTLLEPPSVRQ